MVRKRNGKKRGPRKVHQGFFDKGGVPEGIWKGVEYIYFPPRLHKKRLGIDKKFLASITSKTKILEVGAASGRLANVLLKNSKLKPENYTMLDKHYDENPPHFKRGISKLVRQGRLKLVRADMFEYSFPKNAFNHILVPQAYFSKTFGEKEAVLLKKSHEKNWTLEELIRQASPHYAKALKQLIDRMAVGLKRNGSLRISHIPVHFSTYVAKEAKSLFPNLKVSVGPDGRALIFIKR